MDMIWSPYSSFLKAVVLSIGVFAVVVRLQSQNLTRRPHRLVFRRKFDNTGATTVHKTFKILQLADLHMGEATDTEWGPRQDVKTFRVLDRIVPTEDPDLIVLSGDQLTANDLDKNASIYYYRLCQKLSGYGIPWAMIFGNHDDMSYEYKDKDGNIIHTNQTKTSRNDLFRVDHSFAPLSMTQQGPFNVFGSSNYLLNVYEGESEEEEDDDGSGDDAVALQLLFLDSGGGTLPQQLETNQVQWFQSQRISGVPVVAFQHIPTAEFAYDGKTCRGLRGEGIAPIHKDPGLVEALYADGNVHFLAVGHNHGNDFCCNYQNNNTFHVCFGRHTGYGGYGSWNRGARVYQLERNEDTQEFTWRSWVRMEVGNIRDEYDPYIDGNDYDLSYEASLE